MTIQIDLGATYLGDGRCRFLVWAPLARSVAVHIVSPVEWFVPMQEDERGYYSATLEGVEPGARYFFRINGETDRPDPASRYQPETVHGPSEVADPYFDWEDGGWSGIPLRDYVIYEVHVGTFTPEGTFEAMIPRIAELKGLGINNIEIMPVSQFPGNRNWGYDGVYPFAVQNSYGGPKGFKRFVNECHKQGMSVTLDVVYNHFGPEGNYLRDFGPYFTDRYRTPWGESLNFDGERSDNVRRYFIQNGLYWLRDFHIDALRLDAVHAIYDLSAEPFLKNLSMAVDELEGEEGRRRYLIAESDLNDSRLIRDTCDCGHGLDSQWSDDFHHALHALLTGERDGYYADFGRAEHLVRALNERFVYAGSYSPYRRRSHGNFAADLPAERFVVAIQNHDQIGNRMLGERISTLASFEAQKLAAGVLLLSPFVPLIFMGQEYGEEAPFLYFISHTDAELVAAVQRGRKEEFKGFGWKEEPPNPFSEET
ncbi:MAG: malto-oligosyltrehalose trehalohydrolase, partial [Acidobacteriota bacterium]